MHNEASFRIIGFIGAIDVNERDTVTWIKVCANIPYRTRDGERREEAVWNSVTIFQPGIRAYAAKYAAVGDLVHAVGTVGQSQREDADGNRVHSVDLIARSFSILRRKSDTAPPQSDEGDDVAA